MDTELGAEERDRPVDPFDLHVGTREILVHLVGKALDARPQLVAAHGVPTDREALQEEHRVPAAQSPAVRVEVAEDRFAVRRPAPAVVVGNAR